MKYKVLSGFSALVGSEKITHNKNEIVELEDKKVIKECLDKSLIEIVPIMDTSDVDDYEFDIDEDVSYLSSEELKDLKNKDMLIDYAKSIGLNDINGKLGRTEIEDVVLKYIESLTNEPIKTEYLTLKELKNFETEDELIAYALRIGVANEDIDNTEDREELEDVILEYIESLEAENEGV